MEPVIELKYALDTFYFLVMGAFVMLMACGFAMLEAGLVRGKNTAEILTKNIVLYSIACTMYLLCGYSLMYPAESVSALIPGLPSILGGADNDAADVISSGGEYIILDYLISSSRRFLLPRLCLSFPGRLLNA